MEPVRSCEKARPATVGDGAEQHLVDAVQVLARDARPVQPLLLRSLAGDGGTVVVALDVGGVHVGGGRHVERRAACHLERGSGHAHLVPAGGEVIGHVLRPFVDGAVELARAPHGEVPDRGLVAAGLVEEVIGAEIDAGHVRSPCGCGCGSYRAAAALPPGSMMDRCATVHSRRPSRSRSSRAFPGRAAARPRRGGDVHPRRASPGGGAAAGDRAADTTSGSS